MKWLICCSHVICNIRWMLGYQGGQTVEDEMVRACGMYGGEEKWKQHFLENQKARDDFDDQDINCSIIFKSTLKKYS